jgi:translation initiation factor IF-3
MAHQDLGMAVLKRMKTDLLDLGKMELEPRLEGRQMMMVIMSDTAK